MEDSEIRSNEMVTRVRTFMAEEAASFPPGSLGAELAARVNSGADALANHSAQQVSGTTSARQGTAVKAAARETLREDLEHLRGTARAMGRTMPGLDTKFRIPGNLSDQVLISTARAFVADALPLKTDFIRYSMPANFIEDLNEHIDEFEAAVLLQQTARGTHVRAKAGIDDALEDALDAIRQLDAVVRNTFRNDPVKLAAWTSARHVERAPRRPVPQTTQPNAPTPSEP